MAIETKDRLITDVKSVLGDAEDLLKQAAATSGDRASELREKALVSLRRARERLVDVQDSVYYRGREAARATDDYVHDNPWRSIGAAAAIGLMIGLLLNGRR